MSMVTRCPSCNTIFRVTPQQLQAQQGKVRCGRCMLVFDGFKGLATLPDQPGAELQSPPAAAAPSQPAVPEAPVVASEAVAPETTEASSSQAAGPPPAPEFRFEPGVPFEAAMEPQPAAAVEQPPADEAEATAGEPFLKTLPRPQRGWVWAVGSVLLLFALAGQAGYFYRSDLASKYPGLKPVLAQLCAALGCSVPLPQRPKLIYVEASDLQVVDPARPNVIQLTATLRNHAGYDLAYPALDLALTNTKEHTLARRIFMPAEYLAPGRNVKTGIPGNAEIEIRLDLDIGNLGATGFRLDLLPATTD
jgi:predicted Zn finger-like uncharacterized protein